MRYCAAQRKASIVRLSGCGTSHQKKRIKERYNINHKNTYNRQIKVSPKAKPQ